MSSRSLFAPSILTLLSCLVCAAGLPGCLGDPVRRTSQSVQLEVCWSETGQHVANAGIGMVYNFWFTEPQRSSNWNEEIYPGVTDEHGQAAIDLRYTCLDRTWACEPPPWRDRVDHPYLIGIDACQAREILSLVLRTGASAQGELFTVNVLGIGEPRYLKCEEGPEPHYVTLEEKSKWAEAGREARGQFGKEDR